MTNNIFASKASWRDILMLLGCQKHVNSSRPAELAEMEREYSV